MAPMLIALLASAVLADQKSREDQRNFKDQQKVEAAKERFSAFTGQRGQSAARPSAANTMMQSLLTGAMVGKQLDGMGAGGGGGLMNLLGNVPQGANPSGMMRGLPMPGEEDPYRPTV